MAKNWMRRKAWLPQRPAPVPDFASRAKNLEDLRDAVDDAATASFALWLSYLFVLFYLLIAVGSVTHRDLLMESPIELPFLSDVKLPLVGFFVIGPLLFLIVHAYVLIHFVLLASKVGTFRDELEHQVTNSDTRASLRRQLPNNFIVQLLAGPSDVRTGIISWMLRLIAEISLVAAPVALLLFFQLQFLPYHHDWVTWWHRLAVLIDLAVLWILWPSITRGRISLFAWGSFWRVKIVSAAAASVAAFLLAFTIATVPGEILHEAWPSVRFVPTEWPETTLDRARQGESRFKTELRSLITQVHSMQLSSLHDLLVAGEDDPITQKPASLWSNRLVVHNVDVIDRAKFNKEAKTEDARETFSLRGRRLEGAVLSGANLRKVDFTGARLQGVVFDRADLRGAKFECLREILDCANLQGASFDHAQLQGALLYGARLQGASLYYARLQGAWLLDANLQGALLMRTQLQGATLYRAQLQGAGLQEAYLLGARLDDAQLQGAVFHGTQLQGALLDNVEVDGARFFRVLVWRTDPRFAVRKSVIREARTGRIYRAFGASDEFNCPWPQECAWSTESFKVLKQSIDEIPEGERRDDALKRIEILDPLKQDEKVVGLALNSWSEEEARSSYEEHLRTRAEILQKIGCDLQGAPYVIRRLIKTFERDIDRFFADKPQLAAAFLDETTCPGARGLTKADKARLVKIRDHPPASKSLSASAD